LEVLCFFQFISERSTSKVANHKSALKRAIQSEQRRQRNKAVQTRVKNVVKDVNSAMAENAEDAGQRFNVAKSVIDNAAKKGVLHKRTAARKISRLARKVNAQ
jgi:small subunit ribosomal protein S20